MHVATAAHTDVAAVADAPYPRTLWTYYHLRQREGIDELRRRSSELNQAGLNAIAFHDNKRLADEHRKLLNDIAARSASAQTADDVRANALALLADATRLDQAGAWKLVS